jgi:hypothetical protein
MQHTVAMAIRTVGAQICRRLDVLIEAAGKPPVVDIEGTRAPRRPLAPSYLAAIAKIKRLGGEVPDFLPEGTAPAAALAAVAAHAVAAPAVPSPVTPPGPPKKRGRPPKCQAQKNGKKVAVASDSSADEEEPETADVSF